MPISTKIAAFLVAAVVAVGLYKFDIPTYAATPGSFLVGGLFGWLFAWLDAR
jgi:hypothetical protein